MNKLAYPTGFEDCVIGVCERAGSPDFIVLDYEKVIAKLVSNGVPEEWAREDFEYNFLGSNYGEGYVTLGSLDELKNYWVISDD